MNVNNNMVQASQAYFVEQTQNSLATSQKLSLHDLQGAAVNPAQESHGPNSCRSLFNFRRNNKTLARMQSVNQATIQNLSQMLLTLQAQNEELQKKLADSEGLWRDNEELFKLQEQLVQMQEELALKQ